MNGSDPSQIYDEDGSSSTKPVVPSEPLPTGVMLTGQLVFWGICLLGVVYFVSHPEVVQAILGNLA